MDIDVLGEPYRQRTLDLGVDDEGPVVATLVSRAASRDTDPGRPAAPGARRAVLYVHGFIDYFFQTHLADFFVTRGWDFYALDLRKYGRSLRPYQTPNYCRSLTDYYPELDESARIIREDDGHDTLLVVGHSTGGLIAPLWAHDRRAAGIIDGLLLNSPFFDFNSPWVMRRPVLAALAGVGRRRPGQLIPLGLSPVYGHSIHADHHGEWSYDLAWKPLNGFPVRAGWLGAIREGQRRVRAGLAVPVPVLVAASTASFRGSRWTPEAGCADAVLNVEHIVRWAPRVGPHVTLVRIEGGLHDLCLSPQKARDALFAEADRWLRAYFVTDRSADLPSAV